MSRVLASDTTETDTCPHCGRAVGQEHAQGCEDGLVWTGRYPYGHPDGPEIRVTFVDCGEGLWHYESEDPAGRVRHEVKTVGAQPLNRMQRFVRECYPSVRWYGDTTDCVGCGRPAGRAHVPGCPHDRGGQPPRAGLPSRIRTLRTTDAEWGRYTRAAQREGLSRSEWIRRTLDAAC